VRPSALAKIYTWDNVYNSRTGDLDQCNRYLICTLCVLSGSCTMNGVQQVGCGHLLALGRQHMQNEGQAVCPVTHCITRSGATRLALTIPTWQRTCSIQPRSCRHQFWRTAPRLASTTQSQARIGSSRARRARHRGCDTGHAICAGSDGVCVRASNVRAHARGHSSLALLVFTVSRQNSCTTTAQQSQSKTIASCHARKQ
jgi:hypothetical protein